MSKSFCSGCKHWVWLKEADEKFRYCQKFYEHELSIRSELCGGKYKDKVQTQ